MLGPESGGSGLVGELPEQPIKLVDVAETATLAVTKPMTDNERRIREELKTMP